jgi:hypothetical protein
MTCGCVVLRTHMDPVLSHTCLVSVHSRLNVIGLREYSRTGMQPRSVSACASQEWTGTVSMRASIGVLAPHAAPRYYLGLSPLRGQGRHARGRRDT